MSLLCHSFEDTAALLTILCTGFPPLVSFCVAFFFGQMGSACLPFHAASGEMKLKLVEAEPICPKKNATQKLTRGGKPVQRIVSNAAVSSKLWHRRLNHSSVSLKRLQQKKKAFRNKIEREQKRSRSNEMQ